MRSTRFIRNGKLPTNSKVAKIVSTISISPTAAPVVVRVETSRATPVARWPPAIEGRSVPNPSGHDANRFLTG